MTSFAVCQGRLPGVFNDVIRTRLAVASLAVVRIREGSRTGIRPRVKLLVRLSRVSQFLGFQILSAHHVDLRGETGQAIE